MIATAFDVVEFDAARMALPRRPCVINRCRRSRERGRRYCLQHCAERLLGKPAPVVCITCGEAIE